MTWEQHDSQQEITEQMSPEADLRRPHLFSWKGSEVKDE